ncbi:ABC transporter substrate-binding protein [Microvirga zambiensis]|uniref:ABC transporter substrate-binding protein n=1 Tax=Microvirga zambiensis TaxID=1402137 RepID=UPI00191DD896|nr:ABC transporter substrate-binding protein [Microvirga zambiensis]
METTNRQAETRKGNSMKRTVLGLIFALASSGTANHSYAADGGTLYFGLSGEPSTLDSTINAGTPARTIRLAIHRGLVNYGPDGKLSQELAQSYDVSPDALTYTFKLRDAKFHDGSPVTAQDVKASIERITAADSKATYRNELGVIKSIETPDAKTVKVTLSKPFVPLIHYLALPESAIVPAAWIKDHGKDPNATPIGAGPFKFSAWERGRELTVEKFDGYYKKGKPHLEDVHYVFYADENTRVNALKSSDVDIIDYVPWKDASSIEADSNLKLASTSGPFMMLQFNTKFEPFSKPEVRQAVSYAIDRAAVINTAFNGRGAPLFGVAIPEGYMGYSKEKADFFKHDVSKAKELLAKAGYPNGFEARLLSTAQYGFHNNTAVAVQAELAKIGIKVKLDLPDWSGRIAKNNAGDYDFLVAGTAGDIADPDWLSNFFYGGQQLVRLNNSAYFNDQIINDLLDKGRVTLDAAEREKIYGQFVDRALEQSPFVYLMWRDQSFGLNKKVKGFTNIPGFLTFQSGFTVENVEVE